MQLIINTISLCLIISLGIMIVQSPCPPCAKDQSAFPTGEAPVSPTDQRTKIYITYDNSLMEGSMFTGKKLIQKFDKALNGDKNCRPSNQCIQGALQQWNDYKPSLNQTSMIPYFLIADDPNKEEAYFAPIVIHRMKPGEWEKQDSVLANVCAYTQNELRIINFGNPPVYAGGDIWLPYESINWDVESLSGLLAHEIGHTLGLTNSDNIPNCNSVMSKTANIHGNPPCLYAGVVTNNDRERVTQHTVNRIQCTANIAEIRLGQNIPPSTPGPTPTPTQCFTEVRSFESRSIDYSNCEGACDLREGATPIRIDYYQRELTTCNGVVTKDETIYLGWTCTCQ